MKEKKARVKRKLKNVLMVDEETGEQIQLPPSSSAYLEEIKNTFIIPSKNFVSFTPEAIQYLTENCLKADIPKVMSMSATLKESHCIVFSANNRPHNVESLQKYLQLSSKDELYKLVGRLVKKNVLAYAVCAPSGFVQKIFMLNPYIARKRKEISNDLKFIFRDVTKDNL